MITFSKNWQQEKAKLPIKTTFSGIVIFNKFIQFLKHSFSIFNPGLDNKRSTSLSLFLSAAIKTCFEISFKKKK